MAREFTVEYDDFSGGHYVGDNDLKQPFNTWTGTGIVCTADEGFLMPDGGWTASSQVYSLSSSTQGFATVSNIVARGTNQYRVNTSTGAVTSGTALPHAMPNGFVPATRRVTTTGSIDPHLIYPYGASTVESVSYLGSGTTSSTATWPVVGSTFTLGWDGGAVAWRDWVVGFYGNYLVWTDAGALTVGALNFLQLPSLSITTIVPTADVLYVGASDGWWAVSGVLGESSSLRRISKNPSGPLNSFNSAAEINSGILHYTPTGANVRLLAGSQSSPFAVIPSPSTNPTIENCGDVVVTVNAVRNAYIWSDARRAWRVSAPTLPGSGDNVLTAVRNPDSGYDTVIALFNRNTVSATETGVMYYQLKDPVNPKVTSGSFDSATVDLADYMRSKEFRVKEVLVEIDKGTTSGAGSAARSLSLKLVTHPIVEIADTATTTGTSTITKNFTAAETTAGSREMVRFRTNDAGPTFTAKPVLTLTGVKVRRVIMRCEDV